jgi:methionyl-tRNA formyltransferase
MRVVFFGTPPFAVPSLRSAAEHFSVVGVVTQPDRPAGRGRRPRASAVKQAAAELGLPSHQPGKIRSSEALAALSAWAPEIVVVAAYGQILPASILSLPTMGCVNVHASLLPRWRGASPVQAALLHGDAETGVTIIQMDEGMDTGPILAQRAIPIRADHNGGSLTSELADLGAQLLIETLPAFAAGALTATAQDGRLATLAPRIQLADTALDPQSSAARLVRQVRAFSPKPGARLRWGEEGLRVLAARALPGLAGPPGTVLAVAGEPVIGTGDGLLALDLVQLSGGKPVSGKAFLAGHRSILGDVLRRPL